MKRGNKVADSRESVPTDETARTIESADVVRVPSVEGGTDSFGVQLHARPTPPPRGPEVVLRLTRDPDERESDFVKRAFHEAADLRRDSSKT